MSKKYYTLADWKTKGNWKRSLYYQYYLTKYYNLFLGAYKFEGITPQQQEYILRKLWATGKIASFVVEGTKLEKGDAPSNVNQYPNGVIAFCPFAPFMFDIYDYPIQVNLVNVRGAKFIPTTPQIVNKDVVIGYAQKSHKSVLSVMENFIQKIVDIDMTISVQLKSHKAPWLVACTPENESKLKALFDKIDNDDEVLFLSADEIEAIKVLQGGNAYIIDKLYAYKQAIENEALTYLGIDNIGIIEKKEHLITDEINSNNDLINDHSDNFLTCLKDFCKRIKEVFNIEISVEATSSPVSANREMENKGDNEDVDE